MVEEESTKQEAAEPSSSLCDFCNQAKAVLYCPADAARLCLSCDRHVHLANSVSSKHSRSLLCNSCSSAAASIFCSSHGPAQVFCSNCDFEAHNLSGPHERRPVEAFSGCPSSAELAPALGLGDGEELLKRGKKKKEEEDDVVVFGDDDENGLIGESFWEMPQVVRLDDLIVPAAAAAAANSASHGFQAVGVPPLPKNRNLACGKQKEEILQQLLELIKSEGQLNSGYEEVDPITEFQFLMPPHGDQTENLHPNVDGDTAFTVTADFEAGELQGNNNNWLANDPMMFPYNQQTGGLSVVTSFPDGIADCHASACTASGTDGAPRHHIVRESMSPLTPKPGLELLCPDRDAVISRYKEKRKTRRYDKLIRYESRKARAESRVRIKGRFAKANQGPQT